MQYEVKNGQTIYDVAVVVYGSPQYAVKLSIDNNIDITDSIDELSLYYDERIKSNVIARSIVQSEVLSQPDNNYLIKSLQSIYDLALQFGYGIDRLVEFVSTSGMNYTNFSNAGQTIVVTQQNNDLPRNLNFATQQVMQEIRFLLQENGFYLLQENGSKIII